MRPADFTSEQIIEAGLKIQAGGKTVTGFALRKLVGGGDQARLKKVWDEHLASQAAVEPEPVTELPIEVAQQLETACASLVQQLSTIVVDINSKAVRASERRVAEVVRSAGDQKEQAERELADASAMVDELEAKLDQVEGDLQALNQQLVESQGKVQDQALELAQLRERVSSTEAAAKAQADAANAQLADLRAQLAEAKQQEQMARQLQAQALGDVERAEKQHMEDARVCQDLRGNVRELEGSLQKAETSQTHLAEQLSVARLELQSAREAAKGELQGVQQELDQSRRNEALAIGRAQVLDEQLKALQVPPKAQKTGQTKAGAKSSTKPAAKSDGEPTGS